MEPAVKQTHTEQVAQTWVLGKKNHYHTQIFSSQALSGPMHVRPPEAGGLERRPKPGKEIRASKSIQAKSNKDKI